MRSEPITWYVVMVNNCIFEQAMTAYGKGDYKSASELLRGLAIKGDARAQCMLGFMYYDGEGVAQSYTRAYAWINCSAAQNLTEAVIARGLLVNLLQENEQLTSVQIADKRSGMHRRCGYDRRENTELAYFAHGGIQRRKFVERRTAYERRS